MVDVIVDQRLLGLGNCFFDGVELLSEFETRPSLFDHGNHPPEMSVGAA